MLYSQLQQSSDVGNLSNPISPQPISPQHVSPRPISSHRPSDSKQRSRKNRPKKVTSKKKSKKTPRKSFNWKKEAFKFVVNQTSKDIQTDEDYTSATATTPTPVNYFLQLFSLICFQLITDQTNLYSCQRTGRSINSSVFEIQNFVGMLIMMGIVCLPAYTDYWSKEFQYEKIASVMPLKRFQALRRNLHFTDNNETTTDDWYYKV